MRGIDAAAVYLPQYRLPAAAIAEARGTAPSGVETTAVPAADEDAFTMGLAAAERLLTRADTDREAIESVGFASTTPPLAEEAVAPRLGRALGLPRNVETADHTQGTLAGAEALSRALDATGPALVVIADCPGDDPADADGQGAGAVAFLVADDAAAVVRDQGWYADEYSGVRYREQGSEDVASLGVTTYERNATRECVVEAVAALDIADHGNGIDADHGSEPDADPNDSGPNDFALHAAALHQPDGRMPGRIARDLPVGSRAVERGTVVDTVGDAGAATVPIGLARALTTADNDERSLAGFFGSGGGGAAFVVEGRLAVAGIDDGDLPAGEEIPYAAALRKRGAIVDGAVAGGGANVSVPNWRRTLDQRYRLIAGQCPECGDPQFPPEGACTACNARVEFEPIELPRVGVVDARTVIGQGGAPPEFAAHQARGGAYGVAVVGFDVAGGQVTLPGQLTDADPEAVAVGKEVRATVRRIYDQEGVVRYGAKFVPVE